MNYSALLVGTWVNSMLYMLQIIQVGITMQSSRGAYIFFFSFSLQTIKYFKTFPKDRLAIKIAVAVTMIIDTLGSTNNCVCVYLVCLAPNNFALAWLI